MLILLCAEPMTAKNSKMFRRSLLAAFNDASATDAASAPDVNDIDAGQLSSPVACDSEGVVSEQLPLPSQKSFSPPMSPGGACATVDIVGEVTG